MLVLKKITTLPLLGFLIFLSVKNTHTLADSVYAIPQHTGSIVKVYDILEGYEEGKLEYRATYSLTAGSPADITIDIQSHVLFVTSESSNVIELINAKTFLPKGFVTAEGASDLAGVILSYPDAETTHLFTVERGTNELYAYEWDASIKSLTPITPEPNEPGNPNYGNEVPYYLLEPENPGSDPDVFACGLALDGDTGLLYVSQFNVGGYFSNIVYVYDTQDFETDYFPHVRTIDLGEHEGQDNYAVVDTITMETAITI